VSISPATASVNIGATQQLTPVFTPVNPTNTNVTWATSDAVVATVNASGLVTVIGPGTATITITTVDGGFTATATITATGQGTWTIADNLDPLWSFTGYAQDNCAACFDASAHYSNVLGAFAQYSFTGTEVEAFCETIAGAGSVNIFIDGVLKGAYSQDVMPYGGANKFATITGLSNASHILKFVSTSTNWTGIDYIRFRTYQPGCSGATNTWNGSVSNAWENAANWGCGIVPDANTDVVIKSGTVVLNSTVSVKSLTINPTVSFTIIAGFNLTVNH
jgi:uncharacterized protein YjdB